MDANQAWQAAQYQLELELPRSDFDCWIRSTHLVSYQEGLFRLGASDDLSRDWLDEFLADRIGQILTELLKEPVRVDIIVEETMIDLPLRSIERQGHAPLPDELIERYGDLVAAVGGMIWCYSHTSGQYYRASEITLAQDLKSNPITVLDAIRTLIPHGYVVDLTPDLPHQPHRYSSTDRLDRLICTGEGIPFANYQEFEAYEFPEGRCDERLF